MDDWVDAPFEGTVDGQKERQITEFHSGSRRRDDGETPLDVVCGGCSYEDARRLPIQQKMLRRGEQQAFSGGHTEKRGGNDYIQEVRSHTCVPHSSNLTLHMRDTACARSYVRDTSESARRADKYFHFSGE